MIRVSNESQKSVKTAEDFMALCLVYDMAFSINTMDNVLYIDYKVKDDDEYAQVFFDPETGCMHEAYMQIDEEILEFSSIQPFYGILELVRKDELQKIYWEFGLLEHPSTRYKRRGDYQKVLDCLMLASKKQCSIEYFGNIIRIASLSGDRPICNIAIAIQRGQYKMGMLRRRGITIDVPDANAMQRIVEGF
jgi:hypothetical protein